MDIILYIIAGAAVGLAVGITGVGGGSLMTPLLLLFGFPPNVAVGTDLLYAAVTKSGGVAAHQRKKTIRWQLTGLMALGSLPAAGITVYCLHHYFGDPEQYRHLLTASLGFMLILTSMVILFKAYLRPQQPNLSGIEVASSPRQLAMTFVMGAVLGVVVTLSSVGAGAIAAAALMVLHPRLSPISVIGTDLAHAVPLTLIAGIGHLWLGNVDFMLLGCLLVGSLPAIVLGTRLSAKIPPRVMQSTLATVLMIIGTKYAFF